MMDLTKIEKPFGLLDNETRAALKAHGGPYDVVSGRGWVSCEAQFLASHTYRVTPQTVRGEVDYSGSMNTNFSMFPGSNYRHANLPARVTFSTDNELLIPGTYTGPDGATIKVEALE